MCLWSTAFMGGLSWGGLAPLAPDKLRPCLCLSQPVVWWFLPSLNDQQVHFLGLPRVIHASDMSWCESYITSYSCLKRLGLLAVCPVSIDRIALSESLKITIFLLSGSGSGYSKFYCRKFSCIYWHVIGYSVWQFHFLPRCIVCKRGLRDRKRVHLSVHHTRELWQNERKFRRDSYTTWKVNSCSFSVT